MLLRLCQACSPSPTCDREHVLHRARAVRHIDDRLSASAEVHTDIGSAKMQIASFHIEEVRTRCVRLMFDGGLRLREYRALGSHAMKFSWPNSKLAGDVTRWRRPRV